MYAQGARAVFFDDIVIEAGAPPVPVIWQENHFDPFGLNLKGIEETDLHTQYSAPEFRYQYNGKEKTETHRLMWNNHGARNLDLQLGRWWTLDPLAEKYAGFSPFVGMGNNPVKLVDLNGKETVRPKSDTEFNLLKKTLTKEESQRITLKSGIVKINGVEKGSKNFEYLRTLVNSETTYNIELTNEYTFKDKSGSIQKEKFSDTGSDGTFKAIGGEKFESGKFKGSVDDFVNIYVNPDAMEPGNGSYLEKIDENGNFVSTYVEGEANVVITIGHELYLHGIFYELYSAKGSHDVYNHGASQETGLNMTVLKNEIENDTLINYQSHEK